MITALRGADSAPLQVFTPPLKQQGPQGVTYLGDPGYIAGQVAAARSGGLFDAHPILSWVVPISVAAVLGWWLGAR